MSGLIWIQTVCHSDGIPAEIFQKVDFEKSHQTKFSMKLVLIIYSLHSSDYFIQLIFANNLNPDQAQHNVGLDLDPNYLTLMVLLKDLKK